MWTAAGLRVTALPGFMPQAPPEIRALYQRHARGNSLFHNRGDGTFEDVTLKAGAEFGRWAWSSDALDFDNDGFEDLLVVNGMFTRAAGEEDVNIDSFFWRQVTARSPLTRQVGTPYDDAWRATNRLLMRHGSQAPCATSCCGTTARRLRQVPGTAGLDVDQTAACSPSSTSTATATTCAMSPRSAPQRVCSQRLRLGTARAVRLTG